MNRRRDSRDDQDHEHRQGVDQDRHLRVDADGARVVPQRGHQLAMVGSRGPAARSASPAPPGRRARSHRSRSSPRCGRATCGTRRRSPAFRAGGRPVPASRRWSSQGQSPDHRLERIRCHQRDALCHRGNGLPRMSPSVTVTAQNEPRILILEAPAAHPRRSAGAGGGSPRSCRARCRPRTQRRSSR